MNAKESRTNDTGAHPGGSSARSAAPTATQDLPAADAFGAIGYEAADPALHAPLWSEAIRASGPSSNLR